MELTVANTNAQWVEITKAVFNAYGMKLHYSNTMVSMKASINLKTRNRAETDFLDSPLKKGMKKSLEVYATRKMSLTAPKFIMEFGL